MHDGFNLFVLRADDIPLGKVLGMFADMPDNSHVRMRIKENYSQGTRPWVTMTLRFSDEHDACSALYLWLEEFVRSQLKANNEDIACALYFWGESTDAVVFGLERWTTVLSTAFRHEQEWWATNPAAEELRSRHEASKLRKAETQAAAIQAQARQYEEEYGWVHLKDEADREEAMQ